MEILISLGLSVLVVWTVYKVVFAVMVLYVVTNDPFDPKVEDEDKT